MQVFIVTQVSNHYMEQCDPSDVLQPPEVFATMDAAKAFVNQCIAEAFDPPGDSCYVSRPVDELEWATYLHTDNAIFAEAIAPDGTYEFLTFRISAVDVRST